MNTTSNNTNQIMRERLTILYCAAIERGDLEVINEILEKAIEDADLAQMIFQTSVELVGLQEQEAAEVILLGLKANRVGDLAQQTMTDQESESKEDYLPPVTVRTVLTNLQEDTDLSVNVRNEAARAQRELKAGDTELPTDLSLRGVEDLLRSVGLNLSESAKNLFRRAAIFISMGRENQQMNLAAARKQSKRKQNNPDRENKK